ncbi:54S ribosomal protein L35, mitochondrial [Smittium culicis]|uniref:54S ribosomal protein L35, mitochondrial n=2 Tax=Smittium culicis TaxID=133412 RepID=A0A1R1YGY9_9FUNG|nr:54S ribosomal protein L35, mitochondrial [Smittium culicis]
MQRAYQMYVIPDVIDPKGFESFNSQLNLTFKGVQDTPIEPGTVIEPQMAKELPEISLLTFSEKPKLYTLMMVDPDVPSEETMSYSEKCHWAAVNVEFDIFNQTFDAAKTKACVEYVQPHPQSGSKMHRYIFVALLQGNDGAQTVQPETVLANLDNFSLRQFTSEHNMAVAGMSFFRSEWNKSVDTFYTEVLGAKPPRYGVPLTFDYNVGKDGNRLPKYENI